MHDEGLVDGDQLLDAGDRFIRDALVVFDRALDLAAVDAAFLVGLLVPHLGGLQRVEAERRERTGHRREQPDGDLAVGDAGVGGGGGRGGEGGRGGRNDASGPDIGANNPMVISLSVMPGSAARAALAVSAPRSAETSSDLRMTDMDVPPRVLLFLNASRPDRCASVKTCVARAFAVVPAHAQAQGL